MTMKMMISTSKISMSGTTFGVANAPLFSPTSIPIASLLRARRRASPQATQPRRVGSGAASIRQPTNGKHSVNRRPKTAAFSGSSIPRGGRRRSGSSPLQPLGEQSELIHSGGTNLVHDGNDVAVFSPRIASDVDGLIETARYPVLDLTGDFILRHLRTAKVNPAVPGNGYHDGVVLVGILHVSGILGRGQIDRNVLGQHRRDHHKDDEQNEHDVRHGNHIGSGHLSAGLWFVRHGSYLLLAPRRRMK